MSSRIGWDRATWGHTERCIVYCGLSCIINGLSMLYCIGIQLFRFDAFIFALDFALDFIRLIF